jgi:hypothetical protein
MRYARAALFGAKTQRRGSRKNAELVKKMSNKEIERKKSVF